MATHRFFQLDIACFPSFAQTPSVAPEIFSIVVEEGQNDRDHRIGRDVGYLK